MVHPRKFVRDSLAVALSQYLARAVLLARGLVAAAALGPHGYGGWNALNLIFDYGAYASAGALQGLDLRLPAAAAGHDTGAARRLMASAWAVILAGGALFAVVVAIVLAAGTRVFVSLGGPGLPLLMLAAALLQLVFQYLAASLRAFGRFQAVSVGTAIQAGLGGGLGLALVWSHGAAGLLGGWLAGTVVALGWMRRSGPEIPLLPGSLREGLALARLGFWIFATFVFTLVLRSVDRLALVRYADPERLGLYSLGLMATGLVLYLPEAAAYVLFPRMAAAYRGGGDPVRTRIQVLQTHRSLAMVIPFLVTLGMLWADWAIGRLLPAYRPGVPALRFLSLGAMMLSAATVPGYYLLATGRERWLTGVAALAAASNTALVFGVAARDPRPEAVALAASTGYALYALATLTLAAREWFEAPAARTGLIARTLIPAVWAGATALALCALRPDPSASHALARTALFVTVYVPPMLWLGRGSGLGTLVREGLAPRNANV